MRWSRTSAPDQAGAGEKSFPNTWENSGGSAWAGESSRQAIARELYEETGIRAREEAFLLLESDRGKRLFLTSTSSAAHRRSRTLCSSRGRPATPNGPPWMRSGRWPGPVFWLRPLLAASASRRPGWSGWWKRMRRSRSRSAPYFSVQNSTCLPSRIRLVVRTAHILPHMEQVCRSAGGVLSK